MELPIGPLSLPEALPLDAQIANAEINAARGLPLLSDMPELGLERIGEAALVSGGPSAFADLETIRGFDTVVACGSCHDWLIGHGIVPKYCVVFDPTPGHARFYRHPHPDVTYLVAVTCDPAVFTALGGADVRVWYPFGKINWIAGTVAVSAGSTVTLRAIAIAHILGLRSLHLFGFDCCYRNGHEHGYDHGDARPDTLTVNFDGRIFVTTPPLLQQAQEFLRMYFDHQHELAVQIYGDGLVRAMWQASALCGLGALNA